MSNETDSCLAPFTSVKFKVTIPYGGRSQINCLVVEGGVFQVETLDVESNTTWRFNRNCWFILYNEGQVMNWLN